MPIKVLLVDDSAVIRGLVNNAISADPEIQVVGSAANGQMAVKMAGELLPDIIILDIEMPIMDGITALPEILKAAPNCKVIMASSLTERNAAISFKALSLGASDYLAKPTAKTSNDVVNFHRELVAKIKALGGSKATMSVAKPPPIIIAPTITIQSNPAIKPAPAMPLSQPMPLRVSGGIKAIAIASSTGGPQALMTVFEAMKGQQINVPIFITQHMPATFTTVLAQHISIASGRNCLEVKGGEVVTGGNIYLAQGDYHMTPEQIAGGQVVIKINQDAQENFCRPAADPMLRALSKIYGRQLLVVVLTGMGQDGMLGAKMVVENGGSVIAQDEASCVVYGMPKAIADHKLASAVLPLAEIGGYIIRQLGNR